MDIDLHGILFMEEYFWIFVALGARQRQRVLLAFKKDRTAKIENVLRLSKKIIFR